MKFRDGPISATNWSWEDFNTAAPTYFLTENPFLNVLEALGHSINRFGVVKGITWPSVERIIKENQWNINENNEKSMKIIGFHWFSLTLLDFSLLFISALGHVSTCDDFSHSRSIDRVAVNDCCSFRASPRSVLNHSESSAVAQAAWWIRHNYFCPLYKKSYTFINNRSF